MRAMLLMVILLILILSGCAHVELGKYCEGQLENDVNNSNFIKLNTPEPDDYNPKLEDLRFLSCTRWVKACEWHCYADELGH